MSDPTGTAPHTVEDATPQELREGAIRLLLNLVLLGLIAVPLMLWLPVGETTRAYLLAWLLVGLAAYWLYAGLGFRPLLLIQLILFSTAIIFLSAKIMLVIIDVDRLSILRRTARGLILVGVICATINLGGMLVALRRRGKARRTSA